MNRSFISVILGGFGATASTQTTGAKDKTVRPGSADDAAFIMSNAGSVIIVPGYGLAVAQAQHAVREMADLLKKAGVTVRYAIHPVAGRMPGHMNVLLAEANVPYDEVFELDDINSDLPNTDVAFVIGARRGQPGGPHQPSSPIFGITGPGGRPGQTAICQALVQPASPASERPVHWAEHHDGAGRRPKAAGAGAGGEGRQRMAA
jgi:NAD(P) transhydrogenase subunit beta